MPDTSPIPARRGCRTDVYRVTGAALPEVRGRVEAQAPSMCWGLQDRIKLLKIENIIRSLTGQ